MDVDSDISMSPLHLSVSLPTTPTVWSQTLWTPWVPSQLFNWKNKKFQKKTFVRGPVILGSVSSLLDRLPWQGPWGGKPRRFSGPPPRHRFGHWGVKANQPGTLNQISHLAHGALGRSTIYYKMFLLFSLHKGWLEISHWKPCYSSKEQPPVIARSASIS